MPKKVINRGVRLGRRPTDYIAGTATALAYEERLPSGDWKDDLPTGEVQYGSNGDKMNCVTHSFHNSLETQGDFFMRMGKIPATHVKFLYDNGYIDTNGKFNLNDRIGAILNGTTTLGNFLWAVADFGRTLGLFPQSALVNDENLSWNEYYNSALITPEMKALAQKFKTYFEIRYEWVDTNRDSLMKHLKHAPLQVVIPGHAVVGISSTSQLTKYFDTYPPFIKDWSKPFEAALKVVLIVKQLDMPVSTIVKKTPASDDQYLPSLVAGKAPIRIANQELLFTLIDRGYINGAVTPETEKFVIKGASFISINDEE